MTYSQWRRAVDAKVADHFGVGLDDLPDVDTMSLYEDELTPSEGFEQVVEDLEWMGVEV